MSYRDDLAQAHERIAQLEGELREERAKIAAPAANAGEGVRCSSRSRSTRS